MREILRSKRVNKTLKTITCTNPEEIGNLNILHVIGSHVDSKVPCIVSSNKTRKLVTPSVQLLFQISGQDKGD